MPSSQGATRQTSDLRALGQSTRPVATILYRVLGYVHSVLAGEATIYAAVHTHLLDAFAASTVIWEMVGLTPIPRQGDHILSLPQTIHELPQGALTVPCSESPVTAGRDLVQHRALKFTCDCRCPFPPSMNRCLGQPLDTRTVPPNSRNEGVCAVTAFPATVKMPALTTSQKSSAGLTVVFLSCEKEALKCASAEGTLP